MFYDADHIPVAKAKADHTVEERHELRRLRAKINEDERKGRFLDAKRRTIGINVEFLDRQVQEKEEHQKIDDERNQLLDKQIKAYQDEVSRREREIPRVRRKKEEECKAYGELDRAIREERRETEIREWVPHYQESSMTRFAGEDRFREQRLHVQHAQQRDWLDQQVFEKKLHEAEFDKDAGVGISKIDDVITTGPAKARRARLAREAFEANLRLSADNASRRAEEKKKMDDMNNMETSTQASANFLCETTPAWLEGGRVNRMEYKGRTPAEFRQMYSDCEQLSFDKTQRQRLEKLDEMLFAQASEARRRQELATEARKERDRHDFMSMVHATNKHIAAAKEQREHTLKTAIYANQVTDEFFLKRFGTSTR